MTKWQVCPCCGREQPLTMFGHDRDGNRRQVCKRCQNVERHRVKRGHVEVDQSTHPGASMPWTDADIAVLVDGVGRSIYDVARELGRTPAGVSWKVGNQVSLGLRVHGKVICRREEVP